MFKKTNDKQYHTAINRDDIGKYVLLPGDPGRTDIIAKHLDTPKLIAENREHKTWTGYLEGVKVSVLSTGMGCPSTAIAVEELIKEGAHTFIRVGTAGAVKDENDLKKYDGVIVSGAVRDEGTTVQYIPIEYPALADIEIINALIDSSKEMDYNYLLGISQSKDSFYGEVSPESSPVESNLKYRWEAWKRGNVACSEMECAALFIICSIRQKRAAAIMNFKNMEDTISVAIKAISSLIKMDKENGYE